MNQERIQDSHGLSRSPDVANRPHGFVDPAGRRRAQRLPRHSALSSRLFEQLARLCPTAALLATLLVALPAPAHAAPVLTIDMLTWHVIGLDSNNPLLQGPDEFLSGARVCNTGTDPANDIAVSYIFDTANPYINISPRGTNLLTAPFLLNGDCEDFYFLLKVKRTPLAYNTTREFHIQVSATNHPAISTPQPRELFVEHLISQNRNDVLSVTGPSDVYVGQIAEYTVHSTTATQGYEQLSSFLDFSNVLFRVMSVDVSYSAPPGATNDKVYANACGWDDTPGPTPPVGTYRSCNGPAQYVGGKAGGDLTTVYRIKFLSTGTSSLVETIYDFSGSSYHYNADIGIDAVNILNEAPLPDIQLNKHCSPDPVVPGGQLTCIIEYGNNSLTNTYTGVEINETYDPRTTFVSALPAPDNAPANDHWTIGTLAPGDYGIIVITMNVAAGANDGDSLLNRATLNDDVSAANNAAGDPPGAFRAVETLTPVAVNAAGSALLRVTKTGTPDPEVGAGSNIVYTINYQNLGPATSYSTVLTDTLQPGLTFVSSVPAPSFSAAPSYSWNLGNLASGASGSITVTAQAGNALTSATIVENQALLVGNPGPGTNDTAGLRAYTEEIQFVRGGAQAIADLTIDKTDQTGSDPMVQGGAVPYILTVHNNGPDVATGVVVTDQLDPNTTYTSSSIPCVQAPVGTITCSLGDLAVGATTSITIGTVVGASAPTAGTLQTSPCNGTEDLCNRASVAATTTDPTPANNSADEPTNVTAVTKSCNLSVTKTDGTDPVAPGANLTYSISITNNGPDNAADVIIRDKLDPNTTYVSDTFPSACSVDTNGVVTCHYASLPNGATRTRTITVQVSATAPSAGSLQTAPCDGTEDLCNTIVAAYGSDCTDSDLSDNSPSQPTDVTRPSSDLSITKTDLGSDPVVQGATVTYALSVTNAGPAIANDVVVVDTLDTNTSYISDTAPSGCVQAPTGTLTCNLGTLAVGGSANFNVTVRVSGTAPTAGTTQTGLCTAPGVDICNSATVSSYSSDPVAANNTAQQPTNVTATSANLSIVKSDTGSDPLREGGILTYTVTVTNAGPDAANNVQVADVLDANEFYLEDTASGGCVEAPTGTLTCGLGTIANGASVPFTITVFVPVGAPTAGTLQTSPCNGTQDVCNSATVSASTSDPNLANNTDDEPTDVTAASADLQITKDDTGYDPIGRGANLVYTVHVSNPGPDDAQSVVVTDVLDSNTTYVSDDFGCVQAPAGTLTCSLGAMLAGQSQDIHVTATVGAGAPTAGALQSGPCDGSQDICNQVSVSASTPDPTPANNSDSEPTDVVTAQADLAVTKIGPASIVPGTNAVFTITVTNNGTSDAAAVSVADTTPAGLTFVSNAGDCVSAYPCALGTVPAGATRTITTTYSVPASYTTPDPLLNTATASSTTTDPVPANNTSTSSTPVVPSADVAVTKTGPASIVPGSNAVFTITVTNNGTSDAAAVSVADTTPAGLTFVSNAGDCVSAYPCALGTVPAGATRTITTTYSVPASHTTPDPLLNTATVSSTTTDPVPANNTSTSSTPVSPSADVAVTKTGPASIVPGTNAVFTITVTNNGTSDAAAVSVADTTPAGLTFVSNAGNCVTAYPCALGTVPAGATRTITTTYSVPASYTTPDPLLNTATVSSTTTDPVPANNTSTSSTPVSPSADVSITKTDTTDPIARGATQVYSLTVSNAGPSNATGVVVTDTLDPDTTYVSNTGGCTNLAGVLTCNVGALAGGTSTTFTVTVSVSMAAPTAGTLQSGPCTGAEDLCNQAAVAASTADPDGSNNSDDEPSNVTPPSSGADLSIDKTDNGVAQTGAYLTYWLVVTNNGPDSADAVTVTDTLDANTTFVTSTAACVESPLGTLTCSLGTLPSTLSAGFDVVVKVDATAPTAGSTTGPACGIGEDLCNVASVASATPDPDPANDTAEWASDVIPATTFSEVSVVVSDLGTEPFVPGTDVIYELTVTNPGPDPSLDTVVYDTLWLNLNYVSDTGGCTLQTGADGLDRLACPIGTLPAFSSITFQVRATISLAAPVNFTIEDGDCTGVEDLCDGAVVATRSSDVNPLNNQDSEPTNASANLNCGDGILQPGEQCEPPDAEICNNGIDDDGDGLVDCADPGCAIAGFQSCDANCLLATECLPILNDPAMIRSFDTEARSLNRRDFVKIHGRFIPETSSDPIAEGFAFSLGNDDGEFFRARLLPRDLSGRVSGSGSRLIYRDRSAKTGPGLRQGFYRVSVRAKIVDGYLNYSFRILAYGNLSRATQSRMTTQVYIGDDVAYLTTDWSGSPGHWYLTLPQAR